MTTVILVRIKGGPGSGNWGHAGRPGMVGGSASGGASGRFTGEWVTPPDSVGGEPTIDTEAIQRYADERYDDVEVHRHSRSSFAVLHRKTSIVNVVYEPFHAMAAGMMDKTGKLTRVWQVTGRTGVRYFPSLESAAKNALENVYFTRK